MTAQLSHVPAVYVQATNRHDAAAFIALFAADAVVDDNGREFRGRDAIRAWCQSDIFQANVTLEVAGVAERDGKTVITTIVDGTFDRTGLPDPLVIEHHLQWEGDQITRLTCRLAGDEPAA